MSNVMPVKRIIENIHKITDNMHKHWLNDESIANIGSKNGMTGIDGKSTNDSNNSDDNEYNGYKSSLNDSVVDDLVSTLTNKLCLKSKSCQTICKAHRMSPYHIHNSAISKSQSNNSCYCLNCKYLINSNNNNNNHNNSKHKSSSMSDTYELMQELLKEGSLIKEAVNRLQLGRKVAKKSDYYDCSDDENEINLLNS